MHDRGQAGRSSGRAQARRTRPPTARLVETSCAGWRCNTHARTHARARTHTHTHTHMHTHTHARTHTHMHTHMHTHRHPHTGGSSSPMEARLWPEPPGDASGLPSAEVRLLIDPCKSSRASWYSLSAAGTDEAAGGRRMRRVWCGMGGAARVVWRGWCGWVLGERDAHAAAAHGERRLQTPPSPHRHRRVLLPVTRCQAHALKTMLCRLDSGLTAPPVGETSERVMRSGAARQGAVRGERRGGQGMRAQALLHRLDGGALPNAPRLCGSPATAAAAAALACMCRWRRRLPRRLAPGGRSPSTGSLRRRGTQQKSEENPNVIACRRGSTEGEGCSTSCPRSLRPGLSALHETDCGCHGPQAGVRSGVSEAGIAQSGGLGGRLWGDRGCGR